jgi:hypothetical protein
MPLASVPPQAFPNLPSSADVRGQPGRVGFRATSVPVKGLGI